MSIKHTLMTLLQSMNRFAEVVKQETALLEALQLRQAKPLTARKNELAADYQAAFQAVAAVAPQLKSLSEQEKTVLRQAKAKLDEILDRNLRAITKAREITGRVVQMMADSYRDAFQAQQGERAHAYGSNGSLHMGGQAVSVSFDQTL